MHAPSGDRIFGKKAIVIVTHPPSACPCRNRTMIRFNVCFGSLADVARSNWDILFAPESGHDAGGSACPL